MLRRLRAVRWAAGDRGAPLDAGVFLGDARFFATPYGRGKWISLWADGKVDWKLAAQLVEASYRMVAPKRLAHP